MPRCSGYSGIGLPRRDPFRTRLPFTGAVPRYARGVRYRPALSRLLHPARGCGAPIANHSRMGLQRRLLGCRTPTQSAVASDSLAPTALTLPLAMLRVTVGIPSTTNVLTAAPLAYSDRLFTLQDDLAFGKPLADQLRPQKAGLEGAFSWMATIWPTPAPEDVPIGSASPIALYRVDLPRYYQISVAVFDRRDFSPPPTAAPADNQPPSERAVIATFSGGGDIMLYGP